MPVMEVYHQILNESFIFFGIFYASSPDGAKSQSHVARGGLQTPRYFFEKTSRFHLKLNCCSGTKRENKIDN